MKEIDNVLFRLNKIDYEIIEYDEKEQLYVNVNDNHTLMIDEDSFSIVFSRRVSFNPEGLYSLLVEMEVEYLLKESTENGKEFTEEYINENIVEILSEESPVLGNVSQLFSNISSSMGRVPIITPPRYIVEENTTEE